MKRIVVLLIISLLAISNTSVAQAKTYQNCYQLTGDFPYGVAQGYYRVGTSNASINRKIYTSNKKLDTDYDGIVCEVENLQNPPTTTTTTTTTTTIPRTCAQGGRCSVGDIGPGGGIIFYAPSTNQTWGQALEAAPQSKVWNSQELDPKAKWGCKGVAIPAARGRNVGEGLKNTLAIIKDCPTSGIAAKLAESLSFGGKDDWFLPSLEETILLHGAREIVPGLFGAVYWTSTEWDSNEASDRAFAVGFTSPTWPIYANGFKDYELYVRPIRYVSPAN